MCSECDLARDAKEPTRPEQHLPAKPAGEEDQKIYQSIADNYNTTVRGGPHALLQQAQKFLVASHRMQPINTNDLKDTITAIREYLDNTKEQEPAAWLDTDYDCLIDKELGGQIGNCEKGSAYPALNQRLVPLYLHPAPVHPGMVERLETIDLDLQMANHKLAAAEAKVEELTRQAEPGYWRKCHDIAEATNNALRKQVEELTQINSCLSSDKNSLLVEGAKLERQLAAMTQERDESRRAHQNDLDKLRQEEAYSQQLLNTIAEFISAWDGSHDPTATGSTCRLIRAESDLRDALALPHDTSALIRACKLYAAEVLETIYRRCVDTYVANFVPAREIKEIFEKLRKEAE